MKAIIIISSICILSIPLKGQSEFAPIDAKWCYEFVDDDGKLLAYFGMEVVKDTVIDPWDAKLIYATTTPVSPDFDISFEDKYLYFERNDSIFFIYGSKSFEHHLFIKKYDLGDTVFSYIFDANFIVQNIDSSLYKDVGINRTLAISTYNPELELVLYDHIGPDLGFTHGWWGIPLGDGRFNLVYYEDKEIGKFEVKKGGSCFVEPFVPDPDYNLPLECSLSTSPNPTIDNLELSLECNKSVENTYLLIIFDASGKLVWTRNINFTDTYNLDLSDWSSGQYFGRLVSEFQEHQFSFVKVR